MFPCPNRPSSGDFGRTGYLVPVIALPGRSTQNHRSHALLRKLSTFHLRLFEVSTSWPNRGISAHGGSLGAVPPDEFQHRDESQAGDTQYIGPGSKVESQKHGDHIGLFPGVLCQERQSSSAEEKQHSSASNNPSSRFQHTVCPSLALHNITTIYLRFTVICLLCSTIQSAMLPHVPHRETQRHPPT
jgi:hypothetical protein